MEHIDKEANKWPTSPDDGVGKVLQGWENCEVAGDIIGVDGVIGTVVSGGEVTGDSDWSALREPERPKELTERSMK